MSYWSKSKHVPKAPPDEDDEEEMTIEEKTLKTLEDISSRLKKLETRMEKIEKLEDDRIRSLENELHAKSRYVEMLLSKLLERHTAVPVTTEVPKATMLSKSSNGVRERLAGPSGKLP